MYSAVVKSVEDNEFFGLHGQPGGPSTAWKSPAVNNQSSAVFSKEHTAGLPVLSQGCENLFGGVWCNWGFNYKLERITSFSLQVRLIWSMCLLVRLFTGEILPGVQSFLCLSEKTNLTAHREKNPQKIPRKANWPKFFKYLRAQKCQQKFWTLHYHGSYEFSISSFITIHLELCAEYYLKEIGFWLKNMWKQ